MTSTEPRFGVMVLPDADASTLIDRFRQVEELGFDQLYLPDHVGNIFADDPPWLDGWTLASAAATATARVRVGTLVSNPILRPPAMLAKEAVTVDHLSGGRLELGIGGGVMAADHHAIGTPPWPVRERVARFAEYVRVLDEAMSSDGEPYSFDGEWYRVDGLPTRPMPLQRPRPPIIVGGQAPTMLRVAAERADVWNTNGLPEAGVDDNVARAAELNRHLDELCERAGRDPRSLRRSVLLWASTDPFASGTGLDELVERYQAAGMDDFSFAWPADEHLQELERAALKVIPALRET
ncbi:luciferase-like monooxygenase [Haloactinopolyspora alba]|uniref:Luciferase-like monooxygenase n=1 Tax=Haloactinopolyspora alba TaxID=648780 RepID=A0A2P8DN23_9ACTN|nr:LLM class flavin-dependent oxidoreductase [Haloactinopolyspora alba]PSK98621.1 luciferase-like monooxygenase [Haloactinopolyspora alba]